jgi:hypothetical protein
MQIRVDELEVLRDELLGKNKKYLDVNYIIYLIYIKIIKKNNIKEKDLDFENSNNISPNQDQSDNLHSENRNLKKEIENLKKIIKSNKDSQNNSILLIENDGLKKEIESLRKVIKSYEQRNLKTSELEKIIRVQQSKHEKQIEDIETNFKEKIKYLNRKLLNYGKENKTKEIIIDDLDHKSLAKKINQGQSTS